MKVGVLNSADDFITLLLSCSIIPEEKMELAIKELYKILFKDVLWLKEYNSVVKT